MPDRLPLQRSGARRRRQLSTCRDVRDRPSLPQGGDYTALVMFTIRYNSHTEGGCGGKLLSSARGRCVDHVKETLGVSERRACRVLGHPRSTECYAPRPVEDEQVLADEIVEMASRFGRYGYRRITALLRMRSWAVNHKRVERL